MKVFGISKEFKKQYSVELHTYVGLEIKVEDFVFVADDMREVAEQLGFQALPTKNSIIILGRDFLYDSGNDTYSFVINNHSKIVIKPLSSDADKAIKYIAEEKDREFFLFFKEVPVFSNVVKKL